MKIKYWIPILLIVFIFSFTGCRATTATTAAETTAAAATTAAAQTTQPAETTAAVEIKKYSVSREFDGGDGYKYSETFTVWEPITDKDTPPAQHPLDRSFTLNNYDPKEDLVIPVQIQIHNKTVDFDLENKMMYACLFTSDVGGDKLSPYLVPAKTIEIIANFSNGATVSDWLVGSDNMKIYGANRFNEWSSTINFTWNAIPPDKIGRLNCFLVIYHYYTTPYPEGDAKLLDSLIIGNYSTPLGAMPFITFSGRDAFAKPDKIIATTIAETGPAGGLIFYENPNYRYAYHIPWASSSSETGATATAIGTGMSNTQKIVDIQGEGSYAAKLCSDLTQGGFSDWFMPSKDELNLMYENLYLKGLGSFEPEDYWSSSETGDNIACYQKFLNGNQETDFGALKSYNRRVRAVRAFN